MGKASKRKQERRQVRKTVRRPTAELTRKLEEQRHLLKVLGKSFDEGQRVVAFSLAVCIRVLVHETQASRSLLGQLNLLNQIKFVDTSAPLMPGNLLSEAGLVIMQMTMGRGSEWVPRKVAPAHPGAVPRPVSFGHWWRTDNTKDFNGKLWNRGRMVLDVANKEGGGHIDPDQPLDLRQIEEENSMGWTHHDPLAGTVPMLNGPLLPSIRQIAYELELTLDGASIQAIAS